MKTIDLNADVGEGYDDLALLPYLTSVNIACGGHAGNNELMANLAVTCKVRNIIVGAHPGYEDPENFGRKALSLPVEELRQSIYHQIIRLRDILTANDVTLMHVKPHGALYNQACRDPIIARVIAQTVQTIDSSLAVICPDPSTLADEARRCQLAVIAEGFVDRAYMHDGFLSPRSLAGSVHEDFKIASAQAVALANGQPITCLDGGVAKIKAASLCIHGDSVAAVQIAQQVHQALVKEGFTIKAYTTSI